MPNARPRGFSRTPICVLACACLAAMLVLCSPAAAAEKGAVTDITWGTSRAQVDRTVALLREAGVSTVRANVSWSALEPEAKGTLDPGAVGEMDYAVAAARAAGLEVLMPISDGVPYWASADPARSATGGKRAWNRYWRPRSFADYADFVGAVVRRYKDRGVHTFEIWNEPNHPRFWPSGVNAAEYVQMLESGAAAVRAADPSATVVLGGLTKSDYPYLERVYAAGGGDSFDVVAIHPYTGAVDPAICWKQAGTTRFALDAFCGIEEVRNSMVANGDAAKPIWLTEFGWSTNSTQYGVTEAKQAEFLTKAFKKLETYSYVQKAYWYSFRNLGWLNDDASQWEANTGVVRTDFSAKPALAALKAYTGGALPAPGGDPGTPPPAPDPTPPADAAPTVDLTSPAEGSAFTSALRMTATATDDRGVQRVEFLVDDRVVGSDDVAPYALDYRRARKLADGDHTVAARAIDTAGASATSSVRVSRIRTTRTVLTVSTTASNPTRARTSRAGSSARIRGRVHGARGGRVQLLVARRHQGGGWDHASKWSLRLNRAGRFRGVLRVRIARPFKVLARYQGSSNAAPSRGRARTLRLRG